MSFVHLHVHTHYSLLDGLGTPKSFAKKAKEHGAPAIGITDHGYLYGAIEFYKACKESEIKPIIGCEVYVAPTSRFDKNPGSETRYFHLTLLAKNEIGYRNLMYLVSYASIEGFYYKPRIDFELLKGHTEGLIALSGCLAGELSDAITNGDEKKQLQVIEKHQAYFGKENYYLELQHHPEIPEQAILNQQLIKLGELTGTSLVATQDSHYINKDDAKSQDILLCIQTQTNVRETNRMKFNGDFSLLHPDEMYKNFSGLEIACKNTLEIAEKCDLKLKFDYNLIPEIVSPQFKTSADHLKHLCFEGLHKLYPPESIEKATNQLNYELGVVNKMGFDDYFLIVHDFVKYAKDRGIAVGPGRGSAAGSIIAYSLSITELDPLRYGLIFERFLNPERVSMPDIDIDFADHRRQEVIDYVSEKYGRDRVAQIITFGTMAAKAAVRDVGRGLGYPYSEIDRIVKLVPPPVLGKHKPLKESVVNTPELKHEFETNAASKEVLENAIKLEGTVRHAGTHASAVVICKEPLINYTPVQKAITDGGGDIVTQYSMKPLEEIGLLKMDFLGLKNLTIIENALRLIKTIHNLEVDLTKIPIDDEKTFHLLQKGETQGVFQLESAGMRRYIRELKPTRFEDIIAMISLYRPGPMEWIPSYIEGKHFPEKVKYLSPIFEPILKETNGVAIYQEQILLIARQFAGFSLGEADVLRKAVGKKDPKLLAEQKEKFVEGSVKEGQTKTFATEVFEKIVEPFAGYGFNKAHAACYGMISYRTAYLKANYPVEFMAALLTCDHSNTEKIVIEIEECEHLGIAVLPPSINESFSDFTVVNNKTIRFGLSAIKGVGEGPINEIISERKKNGEFKSIEDLATRIPVKLLNKKTIQALAYSGALDQFGERKVLAEQYELITKYGKAAQSGKTTISNPDQFGLFGDEEIDSGPALEPIKFDPMPAMSSLEKLNFEKQYMGIYVSGHPLKGLNDYLSRKVTLIENLTPKQVDKRIKICGIISTLKRVMTKSGAFMAYLEAEDPTGKIEIVVFTKTYERFQSLLNENSILIFEGTLKRKMDIYQLNCEDIKAISLEAMIKNAKEQGVYNEKATRKKKVIEENLTTIVIPETFNHTNFVKLQELLKSAPGETIVVLEIHKNGKVSALKTDLKINPNGDLLEKIKQLVES